MTSPSEVQEDIGYGNVYHINKAVTEAKKQNGGMVRIRIIRGMHNGQVFTMAERFAADLIRRNYAERI